MLHAVGKLNDDNSSATMLFFSFFLFFFPYFRIARVLRNRGKVESMVVVDTTSKQCQGWLTGIQDFGLEFSFACCCH